MKVGERRKILLLVGWYLLVSLLFKVLLSDGVNLDEAEQLLWAQDLRLGYGAELPLYTWLQAGVFTLFGTTIFAVALLKALLLFTLCIFTCMAAREASGDERCGVVAMLTLALIPQIVWESQRMLTHMVLATALAAMTLYLFLRIANTGRLRYYLLFSGTAALGMLAKYNFGIFLLALLLSSITLPALRVRLANKKSAAALALFVLIIALPFSWVAFHPDLALAKGYKLYAGKDAVQAGSLTGVRNLLGATAAYAWAPVLLYGLIFLRARRVLPERQDSGEYDRLAGRTLFIALIICLGLILFCGVTQFRVRWMQPLLAPLPVFFALMVRSRLSDCVVRRFRVVAATAAVIVLLLLNGRIFFAAHLKPASENEPYPALAEQIISRGFSTGRIIADSGYLAGNLRPHFPSARTSGVDTLPTEPLATPLDMPLLVVWNGGGMKEMPEELFRFLRDRIGLVRKPHASSFIEAPYRHMPGRTMQLGFVIIPPE